MYSHFPLKTGRGIWFIKHKITYVIGWYKILFYSNYSNLFVDYNEMNRTYRKLRYKKTSFWNVWNRPTIIELFRQSLFASKLLNVFKCCTKDRFSWTDLVKLLLPIYMRRRFLGTVVIANKWRRRAFRIFERL